MPDAAVLDRPPAVTHQLAPASADRCLLAAEHAPLCLVIRQPVPYLLASDLQQGFVTLQAQQSLHPILLLLQHPLVVTLGRGAAPDDAAGAVGEVVRSHRGGSVTVHGPGQVVGYPIVNLRRSRLSVHQHVRQLEQVMATACSRFEVETDVRERFTGLWTKQGKIGSIGIAVRRGISWHGFSLYVHDQTANFGSLNPCALPGVVSDCLQRYVDVDLPAATTACIDAFADTYALTKMQVQHVDAIEVEAGELVWQ